MEKIKWIKSFASVDKDKLINAALETENWLNKYSHRKGDEIFWDVVVEQENDGTKLLSSDDSVYAGSAGVAQFYVRLYYVTSEEKYLNIAKAAVNHAINSYKGEEGFKTDSKYMPGVFIGYLCGGAGGAYASTQIYKITNEEKYREYALRVADDLIKTAHEEDGTLYWYGNYGIIGEGGLILFLLYIYETFGGEKYLDAARKGAKYIAHHKEEAPKGGYRWYAMPTDTFPTIKKAGGYFPGFEYGAAGCGYILASVSFFC